MNELLQPVADYYSAAIARHGATPRGVDWNGAESQRRRFAALLRVADAGRELGELDDYGCGYGALLDYLRSEGRAADYLGLDVAERMIEEARRQHPDDAARFVAAAQSPRTADYGVASGIFNVRLAAERDAWERHILATLELMHESSRRGFAFNCLTSHFDPPLGRKDLYYGDPGFFLDFCLRRFSRHAVLWHDYGLYEFTLIVRKSPAP